MGGNREGTVHLPSVLTEGIFLIVSYTDFHQRRGDRLRSHRVGGAPTAAGNSSSASAWRAAGCRPKWLSASIQFRWCPAALPYPTSTAGSALGLPFIPANTWIPRPLPLPNQWFFYPEAHCSFQQPARKNRQADKHKDRPWRQKWLLRLKSTQQTARRSMGGGREGAYTHCARSGTISHP